MPAAALIFVILGALALDATVVFLAERELAGAAAAAANDAAAVALDSDAFYDRGVVQVDVKRAAQVVAASVAAKRLGDAGIHVDPPNVEVRDGTRITVTITGSAPYVFAKALPGAPSTAAVSARATAVAEQ